MENRIMFLIFALLGIYLISTAKGRQIIGLIIQPVTAQDEVKLPPQIYKNFSGGADKAGGSVA